jgi:hypothetical protein
MKSFEIIYEIHVNKTVIIARHMRGWKLILSKHGCLLGCSAV